MNDNRPHILIVADNLGNMQTVPNPTVTSPVVNTPQIDTTGKTQFTDIKNLNNTWVIVKRHNGNVFFKRVGYVTCLKNNPDRDCLFYDKTKAENELAQLNATRKKCKYSIENASKYFVNSFKLTTGSHWNNYNTQIYNEAIPIKDVQATKANSLTSFDKVKVRANDWFAAHVAEKKKYLEDAIKQMPIKLKELETQLQKEIEEKQKVYNMAVAQQGQFTTTDFGFVEQFETQGDKLVKVLFATKPKDTGLTTQDSRGF